MKELKFDGIDNCACGRCHRTSVKSVITGSGALNELPRVISEFGASKAFILSDPHTFDAAGKRVCELLGKAGIAYTSFSFPGEVKPNEECVGLCMMRFDAKCDMIVGVGSGVINDIAKILSTVSRLPYVIVGTAPSMDGYASDSSSMTREGLKISLPSRSADVIIGDTDILCNAPLKMMKSGLGDMIAKYVSICEWRIANIITGEYYCEEVAAMVRKALKRCTDNAAGLLRREKSAVEAVFEGLVLSGIAMNYAGVSRPASGVEHYLSHLWDMRAIEFGTPEDFHGIQCAIGTLIAAKMYEKLKAVTPDRAKALAYVRAFDFENWSDELRAFLGRGAESMIALEAKEKKYDADKHAVRLETIIDRWDDIMRIVNEELPSSAEIEALLDTIDAPKTPEDIGISSDLLPMTFKASKDIRDKYVLPRLFWDLGLLDEII